MLEARPLAIASFDSVAITGWSTMHRRTLACCESEVTIAPRSRPGIRILGSVGAGSVDEATRTPRISQTRSWMVWAPQTIMEAARVLIWLRSWWICWVDCLFIWILGLG